MSAMGWGLGHCGVQDSKIQVTALHLIIGTLQRCYVFTDDNRDTLTHKASAVRDLRVLFVPMAVPLPLPQPLCQAKSLSPLVHTPLLRSETKAMAQRML